MFGKRSGDLEILDEDNCNELSQLIAGVDFEELSPDNRVKIADLVLKRSMAEDLYEIRRWFEESKLWDGL